ncbi:MAG: hypothetical protein QW404_02315 [Candidatus Nanoarchaeia archaeon]
MKDKLRKAMLVGLGLAVVTKEKAQKITKELMKKGELNEKDARALVNKIVAEFDKNRKKVEQEITKQINIVLKNKAKKKKR